MSQGDALAQPQDSKAFLPKAFGIPAHRLLRPAHAAQAQTPQSDHLTHMRTPVRW